MIRKLKIIVFFLLSSFICSAQYNYDTLLVMENYYSVRYPQDNIDWHPIKKLIRYYDAKGRVYYVQGFEFSRAKPYTSYFYYQETYKYGSNDSLVLFQIDEVPRGETKFWAREIWEYSYQGNLLTEARVTQYAHTEEEMRKNKWNAWEGRLKGGSISDTSGWTTKSATRYSYDDRKRLLKKAEYADYADRTPETMWLYTYDQELPDINSYFQNPYTLKKVYNHLYKNDRLLIYREEENAYGGSLDLETHTYTYNKNGEPTEFEISQSKMTAKKSGDPYKKDGKEDVNHREEYKYKDGRLNSKVVHYKYSYTKYKVSFLDRLGNLPSVSSSTMRYGDYQTTTTTTTYKNQPPPRKEDMIAKTKYKWNTYTTNYEYDANGKLVTKGTTSGDLSGKYDSRGRLKEYETYSFDDYGSTRTKYIYGYKN